MNEKNDFKIIERIAKDNFDENFRLDQLFPRMILLAYFNQIINDYDEENSNEDLKGLGNNDGGIDAYVVDKKNKIIYFCQFKVCESLVRVNDLKVDSKDISYLKTFTDRILDPSWVKDKNNPRIKEIANEYKELTEGGYVSKKLFFSFCKEKNCNKISEFKASEIEPIFFEEIVKIIKDYNSKISNEDLTGSYVLEAAKYKDRQGGKEISFPFQNFRPHESDNERESFIGIVTARSLIEIVQKEGNKLFEQNVRYYLDCSAVNTEMRETLSEHPEKFYYYNNGITIICNQAKISKRGDCDDYSENNQKITLTDPQIINGAQTVNSIFKSYKSDENVKKNIDKVAILCKIIQTKMKDSTGFRANLQRYTNSSNPVKEIDFISNNKEQKLIEEFFKEHNIFYQRKRGLKEADNNGISWNKRFKTSPKELAQTIIAWDGEPSNSKNDSKSVFKINDEGELTEKYYKVFRCEKNKNKEISILKDGKNEMLIANYFYKITNEIIKSFSNYLKTKKDKPDWLTIEENDVDDYYFMTEGKFHLLSFFKHVIETHKKMDKIAKLNQKEIEDICNEWVSIIFCEFKDIYEDEKSKDEKVNSKSFFNKGDYFNKILKKFNGKPINHPVNIVNLFKWKW
jgi:hypothetical protein